MNNRIQQGKKLKTVFSFLILFGFTTSFAQEYNLFMTDSLIAGLKVKKRIKQIGGYREYPYLVDHFDEKGNLVKTESLNPYSDSPMIRTLYYYDGNGRRDSSVLSNVGSNRMIKTAAGSEMKFLVTTYKYGINNTLLESQSRDEQGRLNYHSFYHPDSSLQVTNWYNDSGSLFKVTKYFFQSKVLLLKFLSFDVNGEGSMQLVSETNYKNNFNSKGQLESVEYMKGNRSCKKKYKYYKNGLIWFKKADRCDGRWEFKYVYH